MKLTTEQARNVLRKEIPKCVEHRKNLYSNCRDYKNYKKLEEALQMGADALALQEPKKPEATRQDSIGNDIEWDCPKCEHNVGVAHIKYQYCPNCGQKIKWQESDN